MYSHRRDRGKRNTAIGGVIWYSESNTKRNMLVGFDVKTEKFQTWPIHTAFRSSKPNTN